MAACILCGNDFPVAEENSYNNCGNCGSYIYLCDSLSSELNRNFYDNVYDSDRAYRIDKVKKNIFYFFKSIDKYRRKHDYDEFDAKHRTVLNLLHDRTKKILEVGFGTGDNLISLLESGSDAYGIDISRANVDRFIEKHPKYSDRVECSTRPGRQMDVVYTSALFEHLDDPSGFLDDVNSILSAGGFVILDNIPVVSGEPSNISTRSDISFWDGIHKAIYTRKALVDFFCSRGYGLSSYGDFDYFIYRVLSSHKYYGHLMIENIRHPYMSGEKLPKIPEYVKVCNRALTMNSLAKLGFAVFRKSVAPVDSHL